MNNNDINKKKKIRCDKQEKREIKSKRETERD